MPVTLKAQLIIMAVGVVVVRIAHRDDYKASFLSSMLALAIIYLGICFPANFNYFRHFVYGDPLNPELNFFWSFLAYWFGLKWCDKNLPRFSVDWGEGINKSLVSFGFYQSLASCFAFSRILFVFLMPVGALATLLLPLGAIWPRRDYWRFRNVGKGFYWLE